MVLAALLAAFAYASAEAQMPGEWKTPEGLPDGNEMGVRYGVQVGVGGPGGGPERGAMQFVALDYARYNFYNIGFRTGVNWFMETVGPGQIVSVPMQFTWRSGKLVNKSTKADPQGYYYNHQFYPDEDYGKIGPVLSEIFLSRVPSVVEVHAGFTPGMLFGQMGVDSNGFAIERRFTCSADIGGRLNLPIKRFRILVDITYHCYLTRNFRVAWNGENTGRSFIGISGGVAYNF